MSDLVRITLACGNHAQIKGVVDPFNLTPDQNVWNPGIYGTDASGGKWGSYTPLRRCGCGISQLVGLEAPFALQWAAHFPLVGPVQSVPRAELYSIVMLVCRVPLGTPTRGKVMLERFFWLFQVEANSHINGKIIWCRRYLWRKLCDEELKLPS